MSHDFDIWGSIAKRFATLDPDGTSDPLATTYDVVSKDPDVSLRLPNHLPTRRISKGARIIPAEEKDPCVISCRDGKLFVWAFTEGVPFTEACP